MQYEDVCEYTFSITDTNNLNYDEILKEALLISQEHYNSQYPGFNIRPMVTLINKGVVGKERVYNFKVDALRIFYT